MNANTFFLSQNSDTPLTGTSSDTVDTVTSWWNSTDAQQWLIATPLRILLIIVVALLVQWVGRRLVDRASKSNIERGGRKKPRTGRFRTRAAGPTEEVDPRIAAMRKSHEQRRRSRIRTLASVAKSALGIVVWMWAVLAILSEIGVNIGPIIASAGVVGVAIGFGAQSLVKDFLAGIFMLLEDQYGVGDTVNVSEEITGDVEDISLRITTIRDIDGTLWYVRNGEILRLGNLSDEYSIARIEVPVALTNDTEKAWDTILQAITEATANPAIADGIIDEPEMNGLTTIKTDHVVYRVSIKTLPGRQWDVQRVVQSKLINALRTAGVQMPYPRGIGAAAYSATEE
ncbi:mechanosensitive ion channel family protein [Corynebacterium doosanense]|uniref:Mechanosensitive ion channel protein MscS n=1 Tax=Corynebacterium doosanense CAU 212 = DSM 45436 TaxID=558173 RepID=A0A097IHT4_9CORY|nr:mechanosensitive ion channel family protein [Corynebacterium doosanense]AIT61688.1 mechanosensitive ion channel protein MscS [Corynebacterium doosanense CAU 212 = DSM 45436]